MAEIQYNNDGVPLMAYGSNGMFATTTGAPATKPKKLLTPKNPGQDEITIGNLAIADWGKGNKFPTDADATIKSVSVLNSGLKFIRNFTVGQGIFPVEVTGYDNDGNEILKPVEDEKLRNFGKSRLVRRYLEKATRDYLKFGCAFVQLLPNADGSYIPGVNTVNAKFARLAKANNMGIVEKCVVSGKWPEQPSLNEFSVHDILDEYNPLADLQRRAYGKSVGGKSFIQVIRDSWSNNEYYSEPVWLSAQTAGWIDIAKAVPAFLMKAYENQITWKWHVQIPYAFWDKKFPLADFGDDKTKRKAAIELYMQEVEDNLCGTKNANKPIFTMFEINPVNGKTEEQWIITALENKLDNSQNLVTSAAANSEILFSLMINPNVLGAGMPGGTYSGNQGGSNIREAFLVNIANSWLDRQNLLDPLETIARFNGAAENVEWRFRNTILTTLDTGAGTTKTLS